MALCLGCSDVGDFLLQLHFRRVVVERFWGILSSVFGCGFWLGRLFWGEGVSGGWWHGMMAAFDGSC